MFALAVACTCNLGTFSCVLCSVLIVLHSMAVFARGTSLSTGRREFSKCSNCAYPEIGTKFFAAHLLPRPWKRSLAVLYAHLNFFVAHDRFLFRMGTRTLKYQNANRSKLSLYTKRAEIAPFIFPRQKMIKGTHGQRLSRLEDNANRILLHCEHLSTFPLFVQAADWSVVEPQQQLLLDAGSARQSTLYQVFVNCSWLGSGAEKVTTGGHLAQISRLNAAARVKARPMVS